MIVEHAVGLVTIQDLGRPGRMHEGLAPGGALVRGALIAANRAIGNADGAAAIEVLGKLVVRTARGELVVESEPARAAYVAVPGGVEAPLVLGGRATQLSAGIGARVQAGDRIAGDVVHVQRAERDPRPLRVIPGPDDDAFRPDALAILAARAYRVLPTSDRVGTRLGGEALPRVANYRDRSRPMCRGAIEVPPDGQPIVLGPEHPTTGGYPIVGVVAYDDLDQLFAIRLGDRVRFEVGHAAT